jgi:hypothetical protein
MRLAPIHETSEDGKPCGCPIIPSSSHPRSGEIPTPLICIGCGDFIEGTPDVAVMTEAVRTTWHREHAPRILGAAQAGNGCPGTPLRTTRL